MPTIINPNNIKISKHSNPIIILLQHSTLSKSLLFPPKQSEHNCFRIVKMWPQIHFWANKQNIKFIRKFIHSIKSEIKDKQIIGCYEIESAWRSWLRIINLSTLLWLIYSCFQTTRMWAYLLFWLHQIFSSVFA